MFIKLCCFVLIWYLFGIYRIVLWLDKMCEIVYIYYVFSEVNLFCVICYMCLK